MSNLKLAFPWSEGEKARRLQPLIAKHGDKADHEKQLPELWRKFGFFFPSRPHLVYGKGENCLEINTSFLGVDESSNLFAQSGEKRGRERPWGV